MSATNNPQPPLVGILGGMGPAATVDFYAKLIAATPAQSDQEHLRVMIWADPTVPDRSAAITGDGDDPTPKLIEGARRLAEAGATFYVVACNGAHAFLPRVREGVDLDYLSIIDTAVDHLSAQTEVRSVGLMATDATLTAGLYQGGLERAGLMPVIPGRDDQSLLMEAIYAVKAGCRTPEVRAQFARVAESLIGEGVDVLLAACTEVPLATSAADFSVPLIDPSDVLVRRIVASVADLS